MTTMKSVLSPSYTSSVEAQTEGWEWLVVVPFGWARAPKLKSAISLARIRKSGFNPASKVMSVFRVKPDTVAIHPYYGDVIHTCATDAPCSAELNPRVRCSNAPVRVFKRNGKGVVTVLLA